MGEGEPEPSGSLTRTTSAHRRELLRLLASLLSFGLTYLVLIVGCTAAVVFTLFLAVEDSRFWLLASIVLPCCLPLGAYLLSVLMAPPPAVVGGYPLVLDAHPRLRALIAELAREANTALPERVRVVPGVNAAMVGRRELVLGLGLVNAVEARELEAVLAHEFGHFAQSSTRAGQWAHGLIMRLRAIVNERTRLDLELVRARRSGGRAQRALAAVLGLGVEGARSLLRWRLLRIIRSNQAFARELEFNADLHAVSRCGSDVLVAALWKAQRGALAMSTTLAGLAELAKHGVFSADVYAHHEARLAELDERLAQSDHPMAKALATPYAPGPALHFPPGEAPAEIMWYAHPSYNEREVNAKRRYRPAPAGRGDAGPAWGLFEGAVELRGLMSVATYAGMGLGAGVQQVLAKHGMRPAAEVELRLGDELAERRQDPRYHGFYDNRLLELGALEQLIATLEADAQLDRDALAREGQRWRGGPLAAFMDRWAQAHAQLDAAGGSPEARTEHARAQAQLIAEAGAGDRAVFAWAWAWADAAQREELVERHRFTAWVQEHIVAFNTLHGELRAQFAGLDARGMETREELPQALCEALERLRLALARALSEADAKVLPELSNLQAGAAVRDCLGHAQPLEPLAQGQELGPWLRRLTAAVADVHGRLRTLHYKNLGALLRLLEVIEG